MGSLRSAVRTAVDIAQSEEFEQFAIDARDFFSARQGSESASTQITQVAASIEDVAEVLNRSFSRAAGEGREATNVISPVVMPKSSGSYVRALSFPVLFIIIGVMGLGLLGTIPAFANMRLALFGPHYWLLVITYAVLNVIRYRFVMVPDGCKALITKFGKVETLADPGRTWLGFHPRRKVSYIVNITKNYPYNAPIREAPTEGRINASVDMFLQFRIEDPEEFIFTLGGVNGFTEKLQNAISEVTRALIYAQRAEEIYDLVGESTRNVLDSLNKQFLPAVRFVNANITHAEPSSQEYRIDLASPEMVKVAKEAYTYQYELELRKNQDEGELNKELAGLREKLSGIRAEIATYQAQIDTAREKAINQANAYSRQLLIEADSGAKANAALLEAQALDIRTVNSAFYHEILEYRYQQEILNRIEAIADKLPQVINVGPAGENQINFMTVAQQMMGLDGKPLYTDEAIEQMRQRTTEIRARIKERAKQLEEKPDKPKIVAMVEEELGTDPLGLE